MIPVGKAYRAIGSASIRSILAIALVAIASAYLAALIVWIWESSGFPTVVFMTSFLQGLMIAGLMGIAIGRLRLRNVWLAATIGIFSGLASVVLVHGWQHERVLKLLTEETRSEIREDRKLSRQEKRAKLKQIGSDSTKVGNQRLLEETGARGILGSMKYRIDAGINIDGYQIQGWACAAIWGLEGLLVVGTVFVKVKSRASLPFCEDCGFWCIAKPGDLELPGEAFIPLAVAIRRDDVEALHQLCDQAGERNGPSLCGTILHSCPSCDQTFADVWDRKRLDMFGGNRAKPTILDDRIRVSPQLLALLRNQREPLES